MNKPVIGSMRGKLNKPELDIEIYKYTPPSDSGFPVVHPKQCKKCNSKNIMGYGLVSGWGYIDLDTMEVDMSAELDLEINDEESLDYVCMDCGNEWS